jgi:hypothetical protein
MSRQYSSNNPFKGRPNNRPGAGTLRYTWKVPPRENPTSGSNSTKKSQFDDCYGPYDNSVSYVYEIDTSNGNRLAYVDCDYVS